MDNYRKLRKITENYGKSQKNTEKYKNWVATWKNDRNESKFEKKYLTFKHFLTQNSSMFHFKIVQHQKLQIVVLSH